MSLTPDESVILRVLRLPETDRWYSAKRLRVLCLMDSERTAIAIVSLLERGLLIEKWGRPRTRGRLYAAAKGKITIDTLMEHGPE